MAALEFHAPAEGEDYAGSVMIEGYRYSPAEAMSLAHEIIAAAVQASNTPPDETSP